MKVVDRIRFRKDADPSTNTVVVTAELALCSSAKIDQGLYLSGGEKALDLAKREAARHILDELYSDAREATHKLFLAALGRKSVPDLEDKLNSVLHTLGK